MSALDAREGERGYRGAGSEGARLTPSGKGEGEGKGAAGERRGGARRDHSARTDSEDRRICEFE